MSNLSKASPLGGIFTRQIVATGDVALSAELKKFKMRLMEESRANNKTLAQ